MVYEKKKGVKVREVGFLEVNNYLGYSPDGLVGDDGMIEIKCFDTHTYFANVCEDQIKKDHIAQMQLGLLVTGRKWCDYIIYNKFYERQSMYITRIKRDEDFIKKLEESIEIGISRIEELLVIFNEKFDNKGV
jgi:hypothetical protein